MPDKNSPSVNFFPRTAAGEDSPRDAEPIGAVPSDTSHFYASTVSGSSFFKNEGRLAALKEYQQSHQADESGEIAEFLKVQIAQEEKKPHAGWALCAAWLLGIGSLLNGVAAWVAWWLPKS